MGGRELPDFSVDRAELFEALGHPTRIRILEALGEGPLGFSEIKRRVGLESNGLLSFHLGKLDGLIRLTEEGSYGITDEGREALRVVGTVSILEKGSLAPLVTRVLRHRKAILASILIAIVSLSAGALFQQIQGRTQDLNGPLSGTVTINGTAFAYVRVSFDELSYGTIVSFHGVQFGLYNAWGAHPQGALATYAGYEYDVIASSISKGMHIGILCNSTVADASALYASADIIAQSPDGVREALPLIGVGNIVGPFFTTALLSPAGVSVDYPARTVTLYVEAT